MRWPWSRRAEVREAQPFTDAVVEALAAQAGGTVAGDPSAIAALEAAAGLYARCFAAAEVSPAMPAVSAMTRALIGRDLIRRGESVHLLDVSSGGLSLIPCGSWDVRGPWREAAWWYRVDVFGPSGNATHYVPGAAVIHARYAVDPARPWQGIGPLGWARATGALAANIEARLGEEAGATVAHVLPVPQDGGDNSETDPLADLKADIRGARGGTVLVETTAAGWGEGRSAAPQSDWKPRRIGADPPEALGRLRLDVFGAVLGACGVPVSLFTDADGTSQREAFRRFLTTGVQPLAEVVATEIGHKLDTSVSFRFESLYAHDLAGRAQAFQKLAAGGMDVSKALAISGLVVGE